MPDSHVYGFHQLLLAARLAPAMPAIGMDAKIIVHPVFDRLLAQIPVPAAAADKIGYIS